MAWSDQGADWLAHYGVMGMKWGKRKSTTVPKVEDGKVEVYQPKPGTKVVANGGRGYEAHQDAVKAAAAKAVAKNSSTDALSNQELQALVTRMNLEQQYSKLTTPQNKNQMQDGLKKVKQIIEIKKTVDQITQDPFIKEQMSTIAQDFGLDKLIRKGAEALVKKR